MKTIKLSLIALFILTITTQVYAQSPVQSKTSTLKVWGNCATCKARIEKAAKIKGVSIANWNIITKVLSVTYNPAQTNVDQISRAINAAGHDTERNKAATKAYNALPGCCKYERKK